ncbi:DEAD/DEAH box helicase [Flaviflexus sp.]|uniref:DEAD/DEAH box helicase n=1 Tax=Flaviflexus sp. TaxID=1969482 RepID=UPI003F91C66F
MWQSDGVTASPAPLNDALDELADRFGENPPADDVYGAFHAWVESTGKDLYPHQDEALMAALDGDHLIVSTPTGSGKSMIAMAALFVALSEGRSGYYTAPLKALVSEKFFDLIGLFGAANVGMVTGDSTINADAPIICCTAEILANVALREGKGADAGVVISDEFHFFSEPDRGWAWQVPLLELTNTQHILLSATLGDTSHFVEDLEKRTDRQVSIIDNAERPVPLSYNYSLETVSETIKELVSTHRSPVYIVHFSQLAAVSAATELQSVALSTKEQKTEIAEEIGDFRFGPGFGAVLSKLLRAGIGVHHAGMLPRYRRLVERLAQQGLLRVICGTDTLGVGINVPIRTVLLTSLAKFDGEKQRQLTAREFHQIAGRAGRAGFDTTGEVVVQAPEHEIENAKAEAKAAERKKKFQKKKPPEGQVNWTRSTFERLISAAPETLESRMQITHAMMLQILARAGDPVKTVYRLLTDNYEPRRASNPLLRRAIDIYVSLRAAGVIVHHDRDWREANPDKPAIELAREVPDDFALNAPLSPFALAALELLDMESPTYALDAVSIIESVQEDPRPILVAQRRHERDVAMASMKAEGLEYNERMARLDEITWPRPLADLLDPALETYRQTNPWVSDFELSPKSVVRDMIEHSMTFSELISKNDAARSEGVVLRYLTDTYKALRQIIPEDALTDDLQDIIDWLGELVRSVDSSLIAEWEALADGMIDDAEIMAHTKIPQGGTERAFGAREDGTVPITANLHAFRTIVRNWMWRFVEAAADEDIDKLESLSLPATVTPAEKIDGDTWDKFLDDYYADHEWLGTDTGSRSASFLRFNESPEVADFVDAGLSEDAAQEAGAKKMWIVHQVIDDGEESRDTEFVAIVDLDESTAADRLIASLVRIGDVV